MVVSHVLLLDRLLHGLTRDLPSSVLVRRPSGIRSLITCDDDARDAMSNDDDDRCALAGVLRDVGILYLGVRIAPSGCDDAARLMMEVNHVPIACMAQIGGVVDDAGTGLFMFMHTFLRHRNVGHARSAYIADVGTPETLWPRPCSAHLSRAVEWETGRRMRRALAATARDREVAVNQQVREAHATTAGIEGWHLWVSPDPHDLSGCALAGDSSSDEEDGRVGTSKRAELTDLPDRPRILLREYMQRPNLCATVTFVHGGAEALCVRMCDDGRRPQLVVIHTGTGGHCARLSSYPNAGGRSLSVLRRDFEAIHALVPDVVVVVGTTTHNGSRLWRMIEQYACYDASKHGDLGLLIRRTRTALISGRPR